MTDVVLSLRNVTKRYPGVVALNNFSLDFYRGETHALLGENGAGKSTLIKVISGAIESDEGTLSIDGKTYRYLTPLQSRELGVEVIYQEFNLIETLSAAENISLVDNDGILTNFKKKNEHASEIFREFNINIDPKTLIRDLSPAQQQIVEIAKAISKNAQILIMDEPTAPLSVAEVDHLFEIIRGLKKRGVTILYISHRIDEVFNISDRVSVMRDGQYVKTLQTADTNRHELIRLMVGRELAENYPGQSAKPSDVALEVRGLSGNGCKDISFNVKQCEILGIAGLVGAGRTELVRVIYGADKREEGECFVNGTKVKIKSPADAIRNGIGLIHEDRKKHGCFLDMDIEWNASIMNIKEFSSYGFVNARKTEGNAEHFKNILNIKAPDIYSKVNSLSGGNQQKVALAKTLATRCKILIFDEPTRGIDVGAKQEIYNLMRELTNQGIAIIMISSEMEELLGMSDRIVVIRDGRLVGELEKNEFSQFSVLELASGK